MKGPCSVEGCERVQHAYNLCRLHYRRMRDNGRLGPRSMPSVAERLTAKLVQMPNGCLEWTGCSTGRGYGHINVDHTSVLTHRLAWELASGPITDDLCVLHHCDNPPCCNPEHLFLGTRADNNIDRAIKGRNWRPEPKTHCPQGHPYSEANLYIDVKRNRRICRACVAAKDHRRALRKKALREAA